MILGVDLASEVPLYQQLRDRVVEAIASGILPAGSSLPTTRQLASDFGINFHTVNKAYDLLRQQGLLRLTRKTGATVLRDAHTGPPPPDFLSGWRSRARTLLAEAVAHGVSEAELLETCESVLATFRAESEDPA
ncbi:MAG: GntR family transcriptional regulator [Pseudonocardiaceae bacterium]|nr:GntR family transcriptional regulator [Pseudonocardiaceae bacterium]